MLVYTAELYFRDRGGGGGSRPTSREVAFFELTGCRFFFTKLRREVFVIFGTREGGEKGLLVLHMWLCFLDLALGTCSVWVNFIYFSGVFFFFILDNYTYVYIIGTSTTTTGCWLVVGGWALFT